MLEINLVTTPATVIMLRKFPGDVRKELVAAMRIGSAMLEAETKKGFGFNGYPNVRTGNLRRSIYTKVLETRDEVVGILGASAIYGSFLEEGTRHMRARPYLRPTIERNETKLDNFINNRIAQELNK